MLLSMYYRRYSNDSIVVAPVAGRTAPGSVPPIRFSYVTPPVRKALRPSPPSQKKRGLTIPRVYFARSAQPSPSVSRRSCPSPPPSSDALQRDDSRDASKTDASVAPSAERLQSTS